MEGTPDTAPALPPGQTREAENERTRETPVWRDLRAQPRGIDARTAELRERIVAACRPPLINPLSLLRR